jgi:hypothetical protein
MWTSRIEQSAGGRANRVSINIDSSPLSYAEVLRYWQDDAEFRSMFNGLLDDSPFSAFRWETPPVASATFNRPFEFVLLDSPRLERTPKTSAFAAHFRNVPVALPDKGSPAERCAPKDRPAVTTLSADRGNNVRPRLRRFV